MIFSVTGALSFPIPPGDPSLPDPQYPGPAGAYADSIHLTEEAFLMLAGNQYEQFYQAGDGTMTLEFSDCTEGLVKYEITSLGITGEIPIERITPDNVALCETLASP